MPTKASEPTPPAPVQRAPGRPGGGGVLVGFDGPPPGQVIPRQLGPGGPTAWVVGRKVSAFTLTPLSGGTGGGTLAGVWDEVDIETEAETEEISSADSVIQNYVILKDLWRIRMTQILATSDALNVLASAWEGSDLFLMVLTFPGGSRSFNIVRTGYTETLRKGRSVGVFTGAVYDVSLPVV